MQYHRPCLANGWSDAIELFPPALAGELPVHYSYFVPRAGWMPMTTSRHPEIDYVNKNIDSHDIRTFRRYSLGTA